MRIIAGKLKGSKLHIASDKKTRPLKDMTRESIFNFTIFNIIRGITFGTQNNCDRTFCSPFNF